MPSRLVAGGTGQWGNSPGVIGAGAGSNSTALWGAAGEKNAQPRPGFEFCGIRGQSAQARDTATLVEQVIVKFEFDILCEWLGNP